MKHGSVSWHQLDDWDLKLSKFHILSRPMSHLLPWKELPLRLSNHSIGELRSRSTDLDAKQLPDTREKFANGFRLTSPPALPVQTTADCDRTSAAAWTILSLSRVATAQRSRHP